MKTWVLLFGLTMCGFAAHAEEPNCGWYLDESAPHAAYLVYYDTERAAARDELNEELEKKYSADYKNFEDKDLLPFLKKQFPSAADRVELFAYPNENMVVVTFPEDRTPILASMKVFEKWKLNSVQKVAVHPKDAVFAEPARVVTDEPAEDRNFLMTYETTLDHAGDKQLFRDLNERFIAQDLKPWLAQTFPEIVDRIVIVPFPYIQSVNVMFPEGAVPSFKKVRALESQKFETVPSLQVFNGP